MVRSGSFDRHSTRTGQASRVVPLAAGSGPEVNRKLADNRSKPPQNGQKRYIDRPTLASAASVERSGAKRSGAEPRPSRREVSKQIGTASNIFGRVVVKRRGAGGRSPPDSNKLEALSTRVSEMSREALNTEQQRIAEEV